MFNLNLLNSNNRNLQEQLVLFGAGLPCFFMIPFSIYRFVIGDYVIAAIDLLIGLGLVTIFVQTYRSKKIRYINVIAIIGFMAGISWVMHMRGLSMVFWAFPTMGFTYFVLKSTEALSMNVLFITAITFIFVDELTKQQALSIYPSLILVCLFGFGFSLCSERQNQKLLKRVSIDPLTGVKNRRSFDEKVDEILEDHKRFAKPVSMLLLDLDNFKNINDSFGHKQGDQVLIDFAKTVSSIVRTTDYLYRFGGEEFVVIANNSSLENSAVLAESIREFVIQSPCLAKYEMTVSIGVSEIKDNDNADSWFRRADRALYESKGSGRNRVTLAKFNQNNQEEFEDLNIISQKIKPIPTKTHSLVCPRDVKKSNEAIPQNKRPIAVLNIIDKA